MCIRDRVLGHSLGKQRTALVQVPTLLQYPVLGEDSEPTGLPVFWQKTSPLAQSRSYTQSSITVLRDETAHMDGLSQIINSTTPLPIHNTSPDDDFAGCT